MALRSLINVLSRLLTYFGLLTLSKTEHQEAEPLLRRALDIFRRSLGDEHPNTRIVAENYELLRAEMQR